MTAVVLKFNDHSWLACFQKAVTLLQRVFESSSDKSNISENTVLLQLCRTYYRDLSLQILHATMQLSLKKLTYRVEIFHEKTLHKNVFFCFPVKYEKCDTFFFLQRTVHLKSEIFSFLFDNGWYLIDDIAKLRTFTVDLLLQVQQSAQLCQKPCFYSCCQIFKIVTQFLFYLHYQRYSILQSFQTICQFPVASFLYFDNLFALTLCKYCQRLRSLAASKLHQKIFEEICGTFVCIICTSTISLHLSFPHHCSQAHTLFRV